MRTPEQGTLTPDKKSECKLEEVYRILHTNAQMMCNRMSGTLSFYSLFKEERQAEIAERRLNDLGLSPRREGRKLFLTAKFPEEEIENAKNYTTLIK